MTIIIAKALNELYLRDISSREQLLTEFLRVKMTSKEIQDNIEIKEDSQRLFQVMKKTTEEELGFFPADRDDFFPIFKALEKLDPFIFILEIYKNDRMGMVISPPSLTKYIKERIEKINPSSILITEAEKHLAGLKEIIASNNNIPITLTTQYHLMNKFLRYIFSDYSNVKIVFESIYRDCLVDKQYDYIYTLPIFGSKGESTSKSFMTEDTDGIAMENMLNHLNDKGVLDIILPAKITFASQGYEKLRSYIKSNFTLRNIYILPEGTFKPTTSIKTYFFSIEKEDKGNTEVGMLEVLKNKFEVKDQKVLKQKEFSKHKDWRIEVLLSADDEDLRRYKSSSLEKVKLKDVAEVFRGKSILKKDTIIGDISVLNISDIYNGEIDYSALDTIAEDERKIKRYQLEDKDVLLSCRGTAIKSAVFEQQDKIIIASANLIIIRGKEKILGEYIKIFLESPIGLAIIKSFQRGTTVMNINYLDIMELEIPLLEITKQEEMINLYNKEKSIYKKKIEEAETNWNKIKDGLYNHLI